MADKKSDGDVWPSRPPFQRNPQQYSRPRRVQARITRTSQDRRKITAMHNPQAPVYYMPEGARIGKAQVHLRRMQQVRQRNARGACVMAVIYALKCRKTGEIRYVGKANDPISRLKGHMRETRRDYPLYRWIRKNGEPDLEILEECENWAEAERRIISEMKGKGARLLNVADGGDQPHCPPEVRSANGAKVAKKRSAILWAVYKRLGDNRRFFRKHGNERMAEKMTEAIAIMKSCEAKARADGSLRKLENRILATRLGRA